MTSETTSGTTSPRTSPPHENRLARETSPYLLQHSHNPVDWWPWGPEALAAAKASNKPILLSVGYAACHWCHVMAHESFEDAATAAVMNALFINIKVDREERPDIDQIYMAALHALGEQGGWPLTMFLTPDGEPVWGGTYFPKVSRYGRPAFVDIMHEVARLFRDEPHRIAHNRDALMKALATKSRPSGKAVIGAHELDATAAALGRAFDHVNGGLGRAPKFPQCSMLELLWRTGQRRNDVQFFELVELTLTHMSEGGIYDHLGGGFSRYSVDERWLVPHFEKMLYDNAQLLELLALAHVRTGNELYRARVEETVGWLKREMTTQQGAFCASLDADSEGEEGKFYVWSRAEIEEILGPRDAEFFARIYDVTPAGNFEGHNILNRLPSLSEPKKADEVAANTVKNGLPANGHSRERAVPDADYLIAQKRRADNVVRLASLREKLLAARAKRVRPGLDDKVLADWNGLMIAALVNAGTMLREPSCIAMAKLAFAFVVEHMTRGDRLGHSWRAGKLLYPGLASDHAAMIRAALALYEATGAHEYLATALAWQAALDRHYVNRETGGYYLTADDAEGLVLRPESTADEAIPNPVGLAAQNLLRLAVLTGDDLWRERADILFDGILPIAAESMYMHASLLNALDLRLRAVEIVAVGPDADRFADAALAQPYLDRIVVRASSLDALPPRHPARAVTL
ncbi:MAG: thioredoxin domain-containing protein, partial [Xanthobacteraceae bacterium]|nr:thioredoxin domain-containing protein [Xanthobacteraceae bacterium]